MKPKEIPDAKFLQSSKVSRKVQECQLSKISISIKILTPLDNPNIND